MKKIISTLIFCLTTSFCFAQSDSVSSLVKSIISDSLNFKPIEEITNTYGNYSERFQSKNNNVRLIHVNNGKLYRQDIELYIRPDNDINDFQFIQLNEQERIALYYILFEKLKEKALKAQNEYFNQKDIERKSLEDSLKQHLYEKYYKN